MQGMETPRAPSLLYRRVHSHNSESDRPNPPPHPCRGGIPTVRRTGGRFSFNPSSQLDLDTTGGATSQIQSGSGHHPPVPDADERKPVKLSSYIVDPTAAYKNNP